MLLAAAVLGGMNPRSTGFRSGGPVATGGGGITVRPAAPVRMPTPPIASPVRVNVPIATPVRGVPSRPVFSSPGGSGPGTAPAPIGTTRPIGPLTPFKGTLPKIPAPCPVWGCNGPPHARAPISTLAPTMAPSGGGVINSQPVSDTPPSGAPPSMSLGFSGGAATGGSGDLAVSTPIAGFSITQGWLALAAIVAIAVWVGTK